MPQLSIIVPFLNSESTLPATLRSLCGTHALLPQPATDVEILFVDNGSSDESRTLIDEFCSAHAHARCIEELRPGVSAARNAGIAHAQGHYVAWVDSDDEIDPNYLSRLLGVLKHGPDMVILPLSQKDVQDGWDVVKDHRAALNSIRGWWCCQFVFRRRLSEGLFFHGQCYEDFGFFPPLMQRCEKIAVLHGDLYRYRENPASLTRKSAAWRLAQLEDVAVSLLLGKTITDQVVRSRVRRDYLQSKMQLRAIAGFWPVMPLRDFVRLFLLSGGSRLRVVWQILRLSASVLRRRIAGSGGGP